MRGRVLVVEDDSFFAAVVQDALAPLELSVDVVGSAEDALRAARANTPDLVLADFLLPGRNGLELLQELGILRGHPKRVLVTACSRLPTGWGLDIPVLSKPVKTDTLRDFVRTVFEELDLAHV